MFLRRGHPGIESFNVVIRRSFEAGLEDKYCSDLQFKLTLQNMRKSKESDSQTCSKMYFVFTLTHLKIAFVDLGIGYVLNVQVFVAELICKRLSKWRSVTVDMYEIAPIPFEH